MPAKVNWMVAMLHGAGQAGPELTASLPCMVAGAQHRAAKGLPKPVSWEASKSQEWGGKQQVSNTATKGLACDAGVQSQPDG